MRINRLLRNSESGFTLLEVLIAMAIMLVAFASILMVQSTAINSSMKTKQMTIVGMLAKGQMVEAERKIEGKTFDEVSKEENGTFPEPYQDYKWVKEIKEIELPQITGGGGGAKAGGDSKGDAEGSDPSTEMLTKLVTQFLSKSMREVTVTISWKRGSGEQKFSLTTYWVDLNHEFQITL